MGAPDVRGVWRANHEPLGRHQERRQRSLGSAITAAKFLEEFVQKRPWVHLDIAGPAYADSSKAWIDGGASGIFVRTLLDFVEHSAG
ncbi:MAG: hypothetical protein R3B96_15935 [Pirellulaceae bacterium]